MGYVVQLDEYEGPLDRLLKLVEKQEIDLAFLPVYTVIQQLVDFLEAIAYSDIDEGGRFLVMAATLLAIKANLLLPEQNDAGDEEGCWDEEDDESGISVTAEAEYLAIKEAARTLGDCAKNWVMSHKRLPLREPGQPVRYDLNDDVARLVAAFKEVLVHEPVPYQVEEAVDFEANMETVFGMVAKSRHGLPFRHLFVNTTRLDAIYNFLAVLELVFRGRIRLAHTQDTNEITLVAVTEEVRD